jgi:hypothetical protein
MADFNITPVAGQIKPVQGASLGDMINIARGAQQYQQAAQVNPLELQQKQQATRTGEIALSVEEQKDKERINMQRVMTDPSLYSTDGKYDPTKAAKIATQVAPLTGLAYLKDMANSFGAQETFKTSATGAESSAMDFANKQVNAVAGRLTPLINNPLIIAAEQNPNFADKDKLTNILKGYAQEQATALGISKEKSDQLIQPYIDEATKNPANMRQFLKDKLLATLDQGSRVSTLGNVGVSTAPQAPQGAQGTQAVGAGTEVAPSMRLPYPVRSASQSYIPEPTEVKDQTAGQAYRDSLVSAQTGLAQNRRNVEEVIQQANKIGNELFFAKGGVPGQIEQKIRTAIGSEQYDMLAKDLANMALSNTKAMGGVGNTVAGLDMQAVANGTTKVPPDVLVKIARRVQADQTNLDMQANGAQQFAQKFGDNNMKAYQQAWNANADTKIFEAMNIIREVTDPKKQKDELDRLFPNQSQYKDFLKKYRNLKSLSETGAVVNKLGD